MTTHGYLLWVMDPQLISATEAAPLILPPQGQWTLAAEWPGCCRYARLGQGRRGQGCEGKGAGGEGGGGKKWQSTPRSFGTSDRGDGLQSDKDLPEGGCARVDEEGMVNTSTRWRSLRLSRSALRTGPQRSQGRPLRVNISATGFDATG